MIDASSPSPSSAPDSPEDRAAEAGAYMPEVYEELRRMANAWFRGQPAGHTLQPTALIHEAYVRLATTGAGRWNDRTHFVAVAATAMRQLLIGSARSRGAQRRGGDRRRVPLDGVDVEQPRPTDDLIDLAMAIDALARVDPTKAAISEMRIFGGLGYPDIAARVGLASVTVEEYWRASRAWLAVRLEGA